MVFHFQSIRFSISAIFLNIRKKNKQKMYLLIYYYLCIQIYLTCKQLK